MAVNSAMFTVYPKADVVRVVVEAAVKPPDEHLVSVDASFAPMFVFPPTRELDLEFRPELPESESEVVAQLDARVLLLCMV